jgi:hypothetical protein
VDERVRLLTSLTEPKAEDRGFDPHQGYVPPREGICLFSIVVLRLSCILGYVPGSL